MKYEIETELVRKCKNIDEVNRDLDNGYGEYALYGVNTIFELSHEDFISFKENLTTEYTFIKGFEDELFIVVEKGMKIKTGLMVDPQGFGYARYVGFILSARKMKTKKDLKTISAVLEEVE